MKNNSTLNKQENLYYRNFCRPLTTQEIIDNFQDECKEIVPRQISLLKEELFPIEQQIREIKENCIYDKFEKFFFIEALKIFMPEKKINNLQKLIKIRNALFTKKTINKISEADIVKAKNISISRLINCFQRGGRYWCRCPFHAENTPSMVINHSNRYYCFGCLATGSSIDFIMKTKSLTFIQAVKFLLDF